MVTRRSCNPPAVPPRAGPSGQTGGPRHLAQMESKLQVGGVQMAQDQLHITPGDHAVTRCLAIWRLSLTGSRYGHAALLLSGIPRDRRNSGRVACRPMSRNADIDFHFARPLTLEEIYRAFVGTGASAVGVSGRVTYHVDYDWTDAPPDELEVVLGLLADRSGCGEPVGIEVNWPDVVGGNIGLFGDRRVVTFILSAGCRKVSETLPFADMGWYLNALIPALIPLGLGGVVSTDGYLD